MEIFLNFEKPHISTKVFNFLEHNFKDDEAKKNLARLSKGLKLPYKEANAFIDSLLCAISLEDGEEDIPFIPKKSGDEDPSKDPLTDESFQNSLPGSNGTIPPQPNEPVQGTSKDKQTPKQSMHFIHVFMFFFNFWSPLMRRHLL